MRRAGRPYTVQAAKDPEDHGLDSHLLNGLVIEGVRALRPEPVALDGSC